jgi:hypothetical protein
MTKFDRLSYYLIWAPRNAVRNTWMRMKHTWQRAYRGYDDYAYWEFDCYIARIAVPALEVMIKRSPGYPADISYEEWIEILRKIHKAMKIISEPTIFCRSDEQEKIVEEGTALFGKWFIHLWT